jgi:hypothetical protein
MPRARILAVATFVTLLAACGKVAPLQPAAGETLPRKPLMARTTPTPEDLLTPPAIGEPQRVDELMKRSTPRRADPFNLPPPGGEAPTLPVQEENPDDLNNKVGPVTPQ